MTSCLLLVLSFRKISSSVAMLIGRREREATMILLLQAYGPQAQKIACPVSKCIQVCSRTFVLQVVARVSPINPTEHIQTAPSFCLWKWNLTTSGFDLKLCFFATSPPSRIWVTSLATQMCTTDAPQSIQLMTEHTNRPLRNRLTVLKSTYTDTELCLLAFYWTTCVLDVILGSVFYIAVLLAQPEVHISRHSSSCCVFLGQTSSLKPSSGARLEGRFANLAVDR